MDVIISLVVIFACSFLVEALVEAVVGEPINHMPQLQPWKWAIQYVAFGVGVAGALIYRFDFLFLLDKFLSSLSPELSHVPIPITLYGMVLTGLAIGRGASFVHDFIVKFFKPKPLEG